MLKIVGQISSINEGYEIESITKSFLVGNRARELANQLKGDKND